MASIIVASGPSEGDYYPLEEKTVVVGRDAACPIQIVDERISRVHLQVHYDKEKQTHVATDLNSANGTYINHNRISKEIPLVNGDVIELGSSRMIFFTKDFADRRSAWDFYKVSGERVKGTVYTPPSQQNRG